MNAFDKMSPRRQEQLLAFDRMLTIMDELRAQCPWDQKQTYDTLRYLTIEEVFELSDAIVSKDLEEMKKELGDVLLHILFYSKIASEENIFDIKEVIDSLAEKMIRRHPHIYGDVKVTNEEEVKRNWEQIKSVEKKKNESILSGVPKSLPSMIKAMRIQEKARGAGFDWENTLQVWDKVQEELSEFKNELTIESHQIKTSNKAADELGDLFFSLINLSRFLSINPEDALEKTNKKFIKRFTYLEQAINKEGKDIHSLTLTEFDVYWNQAKSLE
jgi:tetrapyrrole methylase family protein/MazG family protein